MSVILSNQQLSSDFYLMKAECSDAAAPGQFYMLRAWGDIPVLSRPVSVYDADAKSVTFLYRVVGQGTEIFSRLKPGGEITLQGPYGNGFPDVQGKVALVGGGVGIAPLFLTAKEIRRKHGDAQVDIFLGFRDAPLLLDAFKAVSDRLVTDVGGYITDRVEPGVYDAVLTCGPEPMMRALYQKCIAQNAASRLYVSMENRMACGIGACLVCTCKTVGGNKKTCKDGPVFKGEAVFS